MTAHFGWRRWLGAGRWNTAARVDLDALAEALRRKIDLGFLAVLAEAHSHARHAAEARAQRAGYEAKSYADHAITALAADLRAAGKAIVVDRRKIGGIVVELAAMEERICSVQTAWAEQMAKLADHQTASTKAVAALAEKMSAQHALLAQHIEAVERRIDSFEAEEGNRARLHRENDQERDHRLQVAVRDLAGLRQDVDRQLRSAEQRIEFVRSETLYELQALLYRNNGGLVQRESIVESRIVNLAKVDAMQQSGLRLNVGCGHVQPDGFVNVDSRELPGIDIVACATDIPLEPGSVELLYSAHLVEHFTPQILERVVLPYWFGLLRPGGILSAVAPDGAAMLKAVNDGGMTFEDFKEVLFGAQDYAGDFHYNLMTPKTFAAALERAGFTDITQDYASKRNGKCFEFKISARKPAVDAPNPVLGGHQHG